MDYSKHLEGTLKKINVSVDVEEKEKVLKEKF